VNDKPDIFTSVIETNKGIVYKIANSYCKDGEERKDLIQEILLQIWKSFNKYDERYRYSTWIYRIALNVAISFYRKQKGRKKITSPFSAEIFNIGEPQKGSETREDTLLLQKFIDELKELDKALMLLYLEEKSHKEIAEILGITETNVATKIGRIKGVLKQKFQQVTI